MGEGDTMNLPVNYSTISSAERKRVREEYVRRQEGLCQHCRKPLDGEPDPKVKCKPVDKRLFPPGFFRWPVHLHHNHETGMTIGAVHCYCNAVLWQYHGE
jgi:hypothetical protein